MIWLQLSTGRLVRTRNLRLDSVATIKTCNCVPDDGRAERQARIKKLMRHFNKYDEFGQRIRA